MIEDFNHRLHIKYGSYGFFNVKNVWKKGDTRPQLVTPVNEPPVKFDYTSFSLVIEVLTFVHYNYQRLHNLYQRFAFA